MKGVGSDIQLGKKGGRIKFNATGGGTGGSIANFGLYGADGATLQITKGAQGLAADEYVTKAQLDTVSAGINVKASVRTATSSDLVVDGASWTGATTFGAATPTAQEVGEFTGVPLDIAGVTVVEGDRVLVRSDGVTDFETPNPVVGAGAERNGIYVVTAVSGTVTMRRANDHGGDLTIAADAADAYLRNNNTTTYGDYTFVTEGTNAGNAYLMSNFFGISEPDAGAEPDLNTPADNGYVVFLVFTQATTFTADQGVKLSGANFSSDIDSLSDGASTANSTIAFGDGSPGGTDFKQTMGDAFRTHNVVFGLPDFVSTGGFIYQTAEDSYKRVEPLPDTAHQGILITDDIDTSGTLLIGIDFAEVTDVRATTLGTDLLLLGDTGVAGDNSKTTISSFISDLDIVTTSAITTGILTKTAAETYAGRSIIVNTTAQAGLSVTNGNGVADNPTLGLNITGLSSPGVGVTVADEVVVFSAVDTVNRKVTVSDLLSLVVVNTNEITEGDSFVRVTDAGIGVVSITVDGNETLKVTDGLVDADSLTVQNLAATRIVLGGGVSPLNTSVSLTFDGTTFATDTITASGTITATGNIAGAQGGFSSLSVTGGGSFGGALSAGAITGTSLDVGSGTIVGGTISGTTGTFSGTVNADKLSAGANGIVSSDLVVAGGVVFAETGKLTQDTGFSYDTGSDTLLVANINVGGTGGYGGINNIGEDQLAFGITGGGAVESNINLTYNDISLFIQNLQVDGNGQVITGNAVDADLSIIPNGTGEVVIGATGDGVVKSDASSSITLLGDVNAIIESNTGSVFIKDAGLGVAQFDALTGADTSLVFQSDTITNGPKIGSDQDSDIKFVLSAGKLLKANDGAAYDAALTGGGASADPAFVTKSFLDTTITENIAQSVKTETINIDLSTDSTTIFGDALPANATILSVKLSVTTITDTAATFSVGDGTTVNRYMSVDENDPESLGIYTNEILDTDVSIIQLAYTVTSNAATVGAGILIVGYRLPA